MPIRIVVIEDQAVFRDMLVEVLALDERYDVAAACATGEDGLEACLRHRPDLAIVDAMLPEMDGVSLARALRERAPGVGVLLLTANESPHLVRDALDAGVRGVVMKGASLVELKQALPRVAAGQSYYCPASTEIIRKLATEPAANSPLTPREREVLVLIARGLTSRQIAHRLDVSAKTIANHRANIMSKLDLHGIADLTRFAIDNGLVEPGA